MPTPLNLQALPGDQIGIYLFAEEKDCGLIFKTQWKEVFPNVKCLVSWDTAVGSRWGQGGSERVKNIFLLFSRTWSWKQTGGKISTQIKLTREGRE